MIIELVKAEAIKGLDEYADRILADEKALVGAHSRTGAAVGSLHIQKIGEFSRFIGANVGHGSQDGGLHALWLDEGNGKGRITAKHRRKTGGQGALGSYPGGIPGYGWKQSVRPYKGIHWVRTVASRY